MTVASEAAGRGGTLVIQPLPGIGDVVWHLPHLRALAAASPDGRVTLMARPRTRAAELLEGVDHVAGVLPLEDAGGKRSGAIGGWRLGGALRRHRFDRVWILHGSTRYGIAAWRAGIPERHGYGFGGQGLFLNGARLRRSASGNKAIVKATGLLEAAGVPLPDPLPALPVPGRWRDAVADEYGSLPRPWFSFAVGASEPFKQWGPGRFGGLAVRLNAARGGTVFVLGGAAEQTLFEDIQIRFGWPDWLVPVIDRPLLFGAALAEASALAVGNDTGMLNIAAAVGTPSVGLFGGSPVQNDDPRLRPLVPPGAPVVHGEDRMAEIKLENARDACLDLLPAEDAAADPEPELHRPTV